MQFFKTAVWFIWFDWKNRLDSTTIRENSTTKREIRAFLKFWVAYLSFKWWAYFLVPLSLAFPADSFIEADNLPLFSFAACRNKAHAPNGFSAWQWLHALSGNEDSGAGRCFTCMRTRYLCAASIYSISNSAPRRLSNSFINQGLQVQPFQKPIRNSVYVLGFFTAQGARKHKNVGEG